MIRRMHVRTFAVLAALALSLAAISLHAQDDNSKRGRKYKSPPPTSKIEVTVVRDSSGKPIENASVIFHELDSHGKDEGNMELKTNEDGKTLIDVIETGKTMRLQIIARGFQTYGGDYKVDKSEMAFEIRMKRPGEQYSTYKPHSDQDQNQGQGQVKPTDPKPQQ
jgi:hypothetical protein